MSQTPLILVIDDSPTVRKTVECHLAQAGYRVAAAPDADAGLTLAGSIGPDVILLDHQLPGTTGEEVCRRLMASEATARVPVLISSAMRNKAYALYAEFPNVIDQLAKPYTPEVLKGAVASALQMGAKVVQAQRTGCAMPGSSDDEPDPALQGRTDAFPLRAVLDFLNNAQAGGRLTLESGRDLFRFALGSGRVQAVYSPSVVADRLSGRLPAELSEFGPLLAVTLGEHRDATTSGLVALLERGLSDPRALRALLRFQSAVLTHMALGCGPGAFAFEPGAALPPMFQAFPLQTSLAALAADGVRRCVPAAELEPLGAVTFTRSSPRGGNVDRAGLPPAAIRLHALLDGAEPLAALAARVGMTAAEAAAVAVGLELAGHAERRAPSARPAILILDDDAETVRRAGRALGPEGEGFELRHVRDRVAAQLLMKRNPFALIIFTLDGAEPEAFFAWAREHAPPSTRFVGILTGDEEARLERLERLGLDGALHRPVSEAELRATVAALIRGGGLVRVP